MHLNVSQQMKMSQQMKLAPRMIQSMEILQLPIMALQERIEQELVENSALENGSAENEVDEFDEKNGFDDDPKKDVEQRELDAGKEDNNASDFERLIEISQDWPDDNYTSGSSHSSNQIGDAGDRQHDMMANATSKPQTLHETLLDQFHYFDSSDDLRDFGEYLIQNLDHNGRLQSNLPEIVQVYGESISLEDAEEALRLIQKLDPTGVGARDLRECLLLQINDSTPMRDILRKLIGDHLDDIAQNRLPVIERRTGYTIDTIKSAIEQMRTLDPYPGRGFEEQPVERVTPDVSVEKDDDGNWVVKLEEEYIPRLRISPNHIRMLQDNPDEATKEWIKKKIESAKWLIDSIEQRYTTMRKVAQEIVNHQTEFLEKGPEYIVPLKMQQIADVVGVHVTTISRAVDDKYITTPRGIFPLKRFFAGGTTTADGEEVAWDIIRLKLKEIVEEEDKSKPLSDEDLVKALAKEGYELARRTVTKYRKAMAIPSSRQRREY